MKNHNSLSGYQKNIFKYLFSILVGNENISQYVNNISEHHLVYPDGIKKVIKKFISW